MRKSIAVLFLALLSVNANAEELNFIEEVYQNNNNYVESATIQLEEAVIDEDEITEAYDPIEPFNRAVYGFNKKTDIYLLKPIAKAYDTIAPNVVQSGVRNFLNYLYSPVNILNYALQGNPVKLANATGAFVANSFTFGLVDVGTKLKINKKDTSFGDTLSVWGVSKGPYIVLPLLGSSSLRDSTGLVADFSVSGVNSFPVAERNILLGTNIVQTRADLLEAVEIIDEASIDAYEFEKSIWYQRRNNQESNVKERE